MRRSNRSHLLVSLALAAPLALPSVALAQEHAPPAPSVSPGAPAPSVSPAAPAPGPPGGAAPSVAPVAPAAEPRPPLITPAPATAVPMPSPPTVSPTGDSLSGPAQPAQTPPDTGEIAAANHQVFSDEWFGRVHPIVELHGYFRTRGDLFQNLALGRHGSIFQGNDPQYLAPIPLDQSYQDVNGKLHAVTLCGPGTNGVYGTCHDETEASANMRLRLDPEIVISDNLRIVSEIFALDNVVLGSTPDAYAIQPTQSGTTTTNGQTTGVKSSAYQSAGYNPYAPIGFMSQTQGPPTAGVNSLQNSINVQRVWAEYMTPVGQLRFGRMPGHWGLGMLENSGDGLDSDYQTTLDRIMFVTGIKPLDLYFGGAWDFVSTGPTNATAYDVYGGQPYDVCNLCNVNEWAAFVAHKTNPEVQRLSLAHGDLVVNGGLYAKFRSQYLDVATSPTASGQIPQTPQSLDTGANQFNGLEARRAWQITPDLWLQTLWRKFRFEAEAVMIYGELGALTNAGFNAIPNATADIREFGVATQTEYKAIEDKLDLQFGFGWASGNPWSYNTSGNGSIQQGAINPGTQLPQAFNGIGPISQFAFHPDYRVDLIFFRNILSRVEGAYYFRPSVDYDFLRHADGEKFGGGAAVIWSRASEFVQTPGHHRDLGVELDVSLYYQSKDGSLNDDPSKLGGFYAMLQYGVFFPLAGLDYLPGQTQLADSSLATAQAVHMVLGVSF
jgi:uncharacterized protein (TIGR04551 family)